MLIRTLMVLVIHMQCLLSKQLQPERAEGRNQELDRIQSEIERRAGRHKQVKLKLSRLFEHSMKFNDQNITIDSISLIPSINIPYKDNLHHSMLLKRNQKMFTLRGDLCFQSQQSHTLISSVRTQQTSFAQFFANKTIKISKLKVISKKTQVQQEILIHLPTLEHVQFDFFAVSMLAATKNYIFASFKDKLIAVIQKNGSIIQTLNTNSTIIQMKKINSNLMVLTEEEFFLLNINKNMAKTQCLMPFGGINYFESDEANQRYVYAKKDETIYQFQLSNQCKPISRFNILPNSTFFPAGQFIFLSTPDLNYAINLTNKNTFIFQLPFGKCLGNKKIEINRKIQNNYIASQICLGNSHANFTHLLIELQSTSLQITDFSKFRIPLLLFSFGIIIYVTVKNKSKDKSSQEATQKEIEQDILKKIKSFKEQQIDNQAKNTQKKLKSP